MIRCTKCGLEKPEECFGKKASRSTGKYAWCKTCANADNRQRYTDPEFRARTRAQKQVHNAVPSVRARAQHRDRERRLCKSFGLTVDQYEAMLSAQGGVCAICGKKSKPGKRLAVDHNHKTGEVRGLLCTNCNVYLLGYHNENVTVFQNAANYLTEPPARDAIGRHYVPDSPPRKDTE